MVEKGVYLEDNYNKYGFQYMFWDKTKKKDEFTTVNLRDMLNEYEKEATVILQGVLETISASQKIKN